MASPTGSRCYTQRLVDSLPPRAQEVLDAALRAPHVRTSDILTVLEEQGLEARAENVNRHRRRLQGGNYTCKCPMTKAVG